MASDAAGARRDPGQRVVDPLAGRRGCSANLPQRFLRQCCGGYLEAMVEKPRQPARTLKIHSQPFDSPKLIQLVCIAALGQSPQDDDVGWHWDADYEARERGDLQHPLLGTVTYLEAGGSVAPTAILEDCFEAKLMAGHGAMIETAHLSLPVPGKHICFDGRLLHAAPAKLRDVFHAGMLASVVASDSAPRSKPKRRKASRTTLLVNIWQGHQPRDPQPLAQEAAAKLTPVVTASSFSLGSDERSETSEIQVGRGVQAQESSWRFGEEDSMFVSLPIPAGVVLQDSVALRFKDGRSGFAG